MDTDHLDRTQCTVQTTSELCIISDKSKMVKIDQI